MSPRSSFELGPGSIISLLDLAVGRPLLTRPRKMRSSKLLASVILAAGLVQIAGCEAHTHADNRGKERADRWSKYADAIEAWAADPAHGQSHWERGAKIGKELRRLDYEIKLLSQEDRKFIIDKYKDQIDEAKARADAAFARAGVQKKP
jgi:hypothetical protein